MRPTLTKEGDYRSVRLKQHEDVWKPSYAVATFGEVINNLKMADELSFET